MTVATMSINGAEITITAETLNTGVSSSFSISKAGKVLAADECYWIRKGKFVGEQSRPAVLDFIAKVEADEAATAESKAHVAENNKREADAEAYYTANAAVNKAMSY